MSAPAATRRGLLAAAPALAAAARKRIDPGGRYGGIVDDRTMDGLAFLGHRIRVDLGDPARRLDLPGGFAGS